MSKYLALLLATHLSSTSFLTSPIITNNLVQSWLSKLVNNRPYYKNIDSNFTNYTADVHQSSGGSNNSHTSNTGTIFNWSTYANSWDEFKNNYNGLSLMVNMNIAFNWYNIKWTSSSLYIPLSNITVGKTNWIQIHEEVQTTTQASRWDACHTRLSYDCWVSGNNVVIRFQLTTWATNNYDNYYYNIDTRKVTCNSTFNYNTIKSKLDANVNNKTVTLASDYSTSLQDTRNWPVINHSVEQLVESALGNYYDSWKSIIYPNPQQLPYAYDDKTNQVTLTINFTDPNTNAIVRWVIKINFKLTLSGDYWTKTLQERLTVTPGKVIDSSGNMVDDKPLVWAGATVYSTTAFLRFTGNPDDSETMTVNGQQLQVIDHQFFYNMTDKQTHRDDEGNTTNQYEVLLEKHDPNDFSHIIGKYETTFLIKQTTPALQLKWHAWNPEQNPDQNVLIQPTINGKPNPKYDPEVNAKTGTKTQIMWIKHKANNPFPLDPLNQQGEIISDGNYEQGFIAEGAVSGMGIEQTFNDPWIKNVARSTVNRNDLTNTSTPVTIKSDGQGSYFSPSGTYHYCISDQKGFVAHKFIIIGQDYENKYVKFLDVLNNNNVAVDFWTTMQGLHLKYYLVNEKQFDSSSIQNLNFEQVMSYWKEYVSDIKGQHIPIPPTPDNIIKLDNITLNNIKMNASDIKTIKNNILNGYQSDKFTVQGIVTQLQSYGLQNNIDYQINNLDDANLNQLLNFDNTGSAIITIIISSLATSTKYSGSTIIIIINMKNSLAHAVDLSQINFDPLTYNFNSFTTEQLKTWILKYIMNVLANYPYIDENNKQLLLQYQTDFDLQPFTNDILQNFLNSKTKTILTLTISSLTTNKAVNSTTLTIINDPTAPPVPPDPPEPKPPTPIDPVVPITPSQPGWFRQGKNLAWFIPIVVLGSGITFFALWWIKIRKSKKIK